MKILFWRRKPKTDEAPARASSATAPAPLAADPALRPPDTANLAGRVDRSNIPTRPLAMPPQVRDSVLRFAVDALAASGAKVRIEAEDLITATLPSGESARYTTTLARAREDEETRLLVQGGAALADLVDTCAERAAVGALRLAERIDPVGAARAAFAEPLAACRICVTDSPACGLDACAQCPLREGRTVLFGGGPLAKGVVTRHWDAWSVELTYEVAYSDRQGRRTEWVRVAFDTAGGEPRAILDPDALRSAQPATVPPDRALRISDLTERAERELRPHLTSGAAFLRIRSERDFRERLADLASTAQRLMRETPEDAQRIADSHRLEVDHLAEVFAVDVEARLHSICLIASPHAEVAFVRPRLPDLTITVDLGRGSVITPSCAACGSPVASGRVCGKGHVTCRACNPAGEREPICIVCAEATGATSRAQHSPREDTEHASTSDAFLSIEQLRAMSRETWRECVGWLIEQSGVRLDRAEEHGDVIVWHGHATADDAPIIDVALRLSSQLNISGEDVRRAVAASGAVDCLPRRIISPSLAGADATREALRLGIELVDRNALAQHLESLVEHQVHAQEVERTVANVLATHAAHARETILADLHILEEELSRAVNTHRVSGRTAIATAAAAIGVARDESLRAFLAWDTLAGEWTSSFDERAGRDGALVLLAGDAQFEEMADRATHLRDAALPALQAIAATPGGGQLGYSAWRRSILEELTARCESCRWRFLAIDPAQWLDFSGAYDPAALERASAAATSAGHAATRVAKAYGDLAQRARL